MKCTSVTMLASAAIAAAFFPHVSRADESGISFWLPGLYGSLSVTPTTPGWSVATIYYHTSVNAAGAAAASRVAQVNGIPRNVNVSLSVSLSGQADLQFIAPTYTFAEPVLGGQFSATLAGVWGRNTASVNGTLTGPLGNTFQGYMVYGAGDVGALSRRPTASPALTVSKPAICRAVGISPTARNADQDRPGRHQLHRE